MKRLNPFLLLTLVAMLFIAACAPVETTSDAPADDAASEATDSEEMADDMASDLGVIEIADGEPIRIAYMLIESGPVSFLGEDSIGGVEIAVSDRGELLGREIEVVAEDSQCSAEGGQTAAQAVAADVDTIAGVIGTNCSSAATAALPIISEAGLTMISSSATAPALTNADETYLPGFFRTAHNDLFQGRLAAEYAYNELGARTMATVHDGSPYADGLQAVAADVFIERGGEITFQGAINVGDTDMLPILNEIATNPPDVLYFPIFEPESNFMADQSTQVEGLEGTILMGADASFSDSFPENTGEAAVDMYFSSPYVAEDNTAYQDLLAKWEEQRGGQPPSGFHAHAYDATNILLDAIESVAEEGDDGTITIDRQALRDAVAATDSYEGITGVLSCGETGDCATGEALAIYQITQEELDGNWPPPVVFTP